MTHLIRGLHNLSTPLAGAVVAMGNFDGLHLGHQSLLLALKTAAKARGLPSVVILFEPQPREFFQKNNAIPRLMRFREKYLGLKKEGIDYCVCLYFNEALSSLSPEDFVQTVLVEKLNTKTMIVGDDFRFGAKRRGDVNVLKTLGERYHFEVQQINQYQFQGERVSSTTVRNALQAGKMALAKTYTGQYYRLLGKVAHGDKRGRELGFPTANIFLHRHLVALSGIYAVNVYGVGQDVYQGVAYVGTRPVFNGTRVIMEVHLFDFDGSLYGKNLEVEFLHKIRDDQHFDSIEKLIEQIKQDIREARAYFKQLR